MQNAVCRRNHTFKRSADQGFKTRMNPVRKHGGSARGMRRRAGRPSSYQIYTVRVYAQNCARFGLQPEQRCSAQRTVLCPKKQTTGGGHDAYFFTQ